MKRCISLTRNVLNMRMLCQMAVWFGLLLFVAPYQVSAQSSVSMAFEDSPIPRVLQALADHQQLNIVIAPGVEGNLSLRLSAVPWQQALDIVLRMGKLSAERHGNVLLVFPAGHLESLQKERDERAAEQAQKLPLRNISVALQYADASDVATSVRAQRGTLLSSRGSVTVDKRTNTLLIRDTEDALSQLEPWVNALDLPLAQVQLAAHIVTISSEHLQALGVNWGLGGEDVANKALRLNNFNVGLPVDTPAVSAGFHIARLNGRLLDLELMALEQEREVEIIASPRLFTAHQQTASIKQGTEIPYQVSSGASGSTSIEFKEAVLGMEVTPAILRGGRITLNLKISQNMPGQAIKQGDNGEALAIDKQEIQTQVTVADGETIVLGGIFQQQKNNADRQVPILGDVPLLGHLFRNHTQQHTRRELVIFITPTLISASS
ncbi:porin [Pectobacterium cacticida]